MANGPPNFDCTNVGPDCPPEGTIIGYAPSLPPNAFFLAFFSLMIIVHTFQAIRFKTIGFGIAMFLGCLSSIIGYAGRIVLHKNAYSMNGFLLQTCTLTIAPAFFSAAIYLCLARLVIVFGEKASRLSARSYVWIFVIADVISLTLQGAGGGLASSESQENKGQQPVVGNNIMISGLVFQVFTLIVFGCFVVDYFVRLQSRREMMPEETAEMRHSLSFKLFLAGLALAYTTIFIRCVYRIAELSGGWGSAIMRHEGSYIACEGVMIVVAVLTLSVCHPGAFFKAGYQPGLKKRYDAEKGESEDVLSKPRGSSAS